MTFTKQYKAQSFPFQQHYSDSFWGSEQNVATNIYYSSKVPKAYWMALSILIHVLKADLVNVVNKLHDSSGVIIHLLYLCIYTFRKDVFYKLIKKGSSMGNHVECWPLSIHSWPWSTHSWIITVNRHWILCLLTIQFPEHQILLVWDYCNGLKCRMWNPPPPLCGTFGMLSHSWWF